MSDFEISEKEIEQLLASPAIEREAQSFSSKPADLVARALCRSGLARLAVCSCLSAENADRALKQISAAA